MSETLHIGLLINPLAGLGGSLALKGSDGEALRQRALALDEQALRRSGERATRALAIVTDAGPAVRVTAWGGPMGADAVRDAGLSPDIAGEPGPGMSAASDTRAAARELVQQGIDLLVFVGGDGTARDVLDAVGDTLPVLGIPAGVKMHSGVFAVSPEAAGELLARLATGGLVALRTAEVRDIDEEAFRSGTVKSRFYGELRVPAEGAFLQRTKIGGREDVGLVAAEAADWLVETMQPGMLYLVGPGSTTAALMSAMGLPNTLLGVDAVCDGRVLAADADEDALLSLLARHPGDAHIIVTAIGGQGHIFGRGNQQFSPAVIRAVGISNITVVAAKSKIAALEGRPLLVDTNDPALDAELLGYREILTGYDDHLLYRVGVV